MIYLDNAATTRPCPAALDAMRTALEDAWGNPSALYRPGQQARKLVEDARRTVARVLHAARPAEITFTSGGTEADVQALYTGAALGAAAGKRHIISTQIEHHAVLHTARRCRRRALPCPCCRRTPPGLSPRSSWRTPCSRTPAWSASCSPTTRSAPCSPLRNLVSLPGAWRAVPH